jgi:hypothetical protein
MQHANATHGSRRTIDRMRGAVVVFALLVVASASARAQVMRYGVVMDAARNALAAQWTDEPTQVERAYCVTQWWSTASRKVHVQASNDTATVQKPDGRDADTVFRVTAIKPVETKDATPNGATFACPPGVPEVHTHPPATCYSDRADQCYAGGADAYSCQPSREDVRKLMERGDAFAIVQCDKHAFVFYYRPSALDHGVNERTE